MSGLTKEEFELGVGAPVVGYILLPKKVGEVQVFEVSGVRINKNISDVKKFSVKDKEGNSVGWNYRFQLSDGRIWDVNKKALFGPLLEWLYPDGPENTPQKVKVKLYRRAEKKSERESYYVVDKVNE